MLLRAVSDKLSLLKMLIWNIDTKKEKRINRERKDRKGIDFRLDKATQLIVDFKA
ncbi:MAG: hypothetical protein ACYDEF_14585 [Methanosarcina sp.]|jgi:hypothetical protein